MQTLILHDNKGRPVSSSELTTVAPIDACDVDHSVSSDARNARPFIQTLLDAATTETQSFAIDAPHSLHTFIVEYCLGRGVRVAFSVGPHTRKVYATFQAVV